MSANRRRIGSERGKALQRRQADVNERSFAHTLESGGIRRVHLRGRINIYKRMCIHAAGRFQLKSDPAQSLAQAPPPKGFMALIGP